MDVLERQELPLQERLKLLEHADPKVREIGQALIDPSQVIEYGDVKEAVESIRLWEEETRGSEDQQRSYA